MKTLIKLTMASNNADIWVNPNYISSMMKGYECTNLFIAHDENPVFIRESPEQILEMIQSVYGDRLD